MDARDMFSLDGKVAIVTGGASRFGKPISEGLAEMGAIVIIASRNEKQCEQFAEELRERKLEAIGIHLDLADDKSIKAVVDEVVEKYGHIDVLVNNAVRRGLIGEVEELERDTMMKSLDVNFTGQVLMSKAVLPQMKKQRKGSIIMVSSLAALRAPRFSLLEPEQKNPANYMMEKCGMNGLTLWLAAKYGPYNIRVNCICPGSFNPELYTNPKLMGYVKTFEKHCPMQRFIKEHEVKGPVVFFASDASSYCSGTILPLDGAFSA
ncbi:MAG TPA: SDR family oxidoreductase [Clostridiales bacterium]|jgi:NAD(P)-dependent dehydrogenase (short-subunit alcohol dehydrogenase family)|nr:SDR family oxidoreductase [Clostridiales bacterium]